MNYTFEMNNLRQDARFSTKPYREISPVVQVFSAMAEGRELPKFNKVGVADKSVECIKELSARAAANDFTAISELNEIRKFAIQPRLLQEMKLLSVFGTYKQLGWRDTAQLETIIFENVRADIQAEGQDVSTPFMRRKKRILSPITISGGHRVNYRELQFGDAATENQLMEEVRKQIRNKAVTYIMETVFNAFKEAKGVKYFVEMATLTKVGVDDILVKLRRYGKPNVIGDYSILSQFIPWAGYSGKIGDNDITGISQKILDEIADTGIMGKYNGAILQEMPNSYNYSELNKDGTNYNTLLPAGLALVVPAAPIGGVAPIQTFTIGGLTSFSGNDVSTGEVMTRFDLAIACGVAATDTIGIIHDTNLDELTTG